MKNRQFTARNSHTRSASIGRNLNRLSEISGSNGSLNTTNTHQSRPNLNRSKSSDGLTRRSRSVTKLSALQPLKRSASHQQVHSSNTVVKVINNDQVDEEGESDANEAENQENEVTEEVENFSDEETKPEPEPEQVLSYKPPAHFSHTLIKPGSSFSSESRSQSQEVTDQPAKPNEMSSLIDVDKLAAVANKLGLQNTEGKQKEETGEKTKDSERSINAVQHSDELVPLKDQQQLVSQKNDSQKPLSKEDLKNDQYFQNMILSQSTGVVRAFGDRPFQNSLLNIQNKHQDALQYIHSNDFIGGSNLKSNSSSVNSLRQFTINQQLLHKNSSHKLSESHESSSVLSFRAEPSGRDLQMTSLSRSQTKNSDKTLSDTPNNFNNFLRSNNANIETRTQQKLWLQRENSLLDFSELNNNQTNPQVRREFEKVSREYQYLRRFNNPILESVKRVSSASNKKQNSSQQSSNQISNGVNLKENLNSFKSTSIQSKLTKLWIEGESSNKHHHQEYITQQNSRQQQLQRPLTVQTQSSINGFYNNQGVINRSPVAPTTRAVDRANNSPENKRIDISAIRLQEAEQLQKLS